MSERTAAFISDTYGYVLFEIVLLLGSIPFTPIHHFAQACSSRAIML